MIPPILTSPILYNITQTTQAQVGIETGLKAVGRPGFILLDNSIDKNTKKYSSMKEFLYQLTCFTASMLVIIPIFKKGSFAIAKKFYKDEPILQKFKNSDEFHKFYKQTDKSNRIQKLRELYGEDGKNFSDEVLTNHVNFAKGIIEFTSIAGSVLGLSIVAPMISRPLIRPVLKVLNLNENNDEKQNNTNNSEPAKQVKEIATV